MQAQLINIATTMALCFLAWGLFHAYLHPRGFDYVRNFWRVSGYFVLVALVFGTLYWERLGSIVRDFAWTPVVALGLFAAVQAMFFVYIPRRLREPKAHLEAYPERYYLKMDWRRLISKSADIAAQQVFIVLLVVFLRDAGLSMYQTVGAFLFLFALLHVPLIVREKGRWPSWLFAGAVLVFGIVFPPLILHVSYGFVYTYIIHWLFYMATVLVFWSMHHKRDIAA